MSATKTPVEPKSRILIADDNPPNVELFEAFLAGVDCEIAIAGDGHGNSRRSPRSSPT